MSEGRFSINPFEDRERQGVDVQLASRLFLAIGEETADAVLEPAALARAAARALRVDGAGLSTMVRVLNQPLAATDDDSREAEVLQTTLGDGPCLHGSTARDAVVYDLPGLQVHWPQYAEELTTRTRYRSVASIALRAYGPDAFAALDVYGKSPQLSCALNPTDIAVVGRITGALLEICLEQVSEVSQLNGGPDWYHSVSARRQDVWVAIGMVMAHQGERTRNALSLLRAQAYGSSRSLDDVAADLVNGRLPLNAMLE